MRSCRPPGRCASSGPPSGAGGGAGLAAHKGKTNHNPNTVSTTLPLFREMVESEPTFRAGVYTTAYLEEAAGRLSSLSL